MAAASCPGVQAFGGRALLIALMALLAPAATWAQADYPSRPVRLLIPFPAGGAADMIARTLGERLTAQVGQPMVFDNRPGAGGVVSADLLAKAAADGYTMMVGAPGPMVIAPLLSSRLSYLPQRDFLPVSRVSEVLNVMVVNPATGVRSVEEFVGWARKRAGDVRYGSSGAGQPDHLAGEFLARLTGVPMIHIPYKGGGPAMVDLMSGQIQLMFATYVVARPHAEAGRLRILGVITPERQALLPGLPSVGEAVPGFGLNNWNGIFVPAKTPQPAVDRLFAEINRALGDPDLKKRQNASGIEPVGSPSQQHFVAFVQSEHERWGRIIRESGIRVE